ncbi:MAG: hypothetical protein WED33_06005 [Bacteroidia bacterium]
MEVNLNTVKQWFNSKGFKQVSFDKDSCIITTYYLDHLVSFKLTSRDGFMTLYKEVSQGGILVFELSLSGQNFTYDAYSPLWLFGIIQRKKRFKEKSMPWAKYLVDGFKIEQEFKHKFMLKS